MRQLSLKGRTRGFTVIELLIVIGVIAILATIAIVAYNGITSNARDRAVESDAESVASEVADYGTQNNGEYGAAIEWYSGGAANININFSPTQGNIIDVVASDDDYCIRVYNPSAQTYGNLYTAVVEGSSEGVCDDLLPSSAAIAANGGAGSNLVSTVIGSDDHACAITMARAAFCWGYNTNGQVGNNSTTDATTPAAVDTSGVLAGKTIKHLVAGIYSTCAIASDDLAYCWGSSASYGRLGNGSTGSSSVPVAVSTAGVLAGKTIKDMVMTRTNNICAIASDDLAYCWGSGQYGLLGNGSLSDSTVPVAVDTTGVLAGKTIKKIALSTSDFGCVIASDDKVYCWGVMTSGHLGNNSLSGTSSVPVAVNTAGVLAGKTVLDIVVGDNSTCVLASDKKVYCWGYNNNGELGNNSVATSAVPVAVNTAGVLAGKTVKSIYGDKTSYFCVIASDDKPYCWGNSLAGQLGNGINADSTVPVAVDTTGVLAGKTIKKMTSKSNSTCVIASDDLLYCWGYNFTGQLGINSTTSSYVPATVNTSGVLAGKSIKSVNIQDQRTCAITTDYGLYCWGDGQYGQLGNGSTSNSLIPSRVQTIGI